MRVERGAHGPVVSALQQKLNQDFVPRREPGLPVDGNFGPGTEAALRAWQRRVGLIPDGVAGPATLRKMFPLGMPELKVRFDHAWQPSLSIALLLGHCPNSRADQACAKPVRSLYMSNKGLTFLYELEAQPGVSNRLHWPRGASGVTLGAGYDMKLRSAADIRRALTGAGVGKQMAEIASKGAGLTGDQAAEFCRTHRKDVLLEEKQEERLLREIVPEYERLVRRSVRIDLQQHQFDALVSFAYNPGGRLASVTRLVNAGRTGEAMARIRATNTSGGQVLAGLTLRRTKEIKLYLNADYAGASA